MGVCSVSDEDIMRKQISGEDISFLDKNMFVEAGAGAGKTTLIVSRIVNQILNGDEPGSFVVITFTNAAAEELRQRIIAKVAKTAAQNEIAKRALDHLDEMNISTIHSFCNVLLKEQPFLAKVPQDMELIEGDKQEELKDIYFNEFFAKLSVNDWNAIKQYGNGALRYQVKGALEGLYKQIVDLPLDTDIAAPAQANVVISEAESEYQNKMAIADDIVSEILKSLNYLLKGNKNDGYNFQFATIQDALNAVGGKSGKKKLTFFLGALEKRLNIYLDANASEEEKADAILGLLFTKNESRSFFSEADKSFCYDDIASLFKAEKKKLADYIDKRLAKFKPFVPDKVKTNDKFCETFENAIRNENYYRVLLDFALQARKYYRDNRPKKYITNDNLIEFTRDLICNDDNAEVLNFYSKKYKHFYIDEFQDTDRVQAAFLYRLASDPGDARHERLRDGSLFVVGDPKQSIYRFRGAQPEVYFEIKDRMSKPEMSNAICYELERNFRSNGAVIDWVNDKFTDSDSSMPIIDSTHPYKKMVWKKSVYDEATMKANKIISGIYHYGNADATRTGDDGNSVNCKYTVDEDIKDVINLILNLKNGGYKIVDEYDFNTGKPTGFRNIQFRDILLIPLSMTKMADYLAALKAFGIPVSFAGKTDLAVDKAINTFTKLYWYVVNPKERFHRMGAKEAIRENLSGLTEKVLAEFSEGLLEYLDNNTKNMSAYGKAIYLEGQISALYEKDRQYDVIDVYGIKTRIRQMIEYVFSKETGTGVQIAEAFDNYIHTELEHELSLEENADAVRFMNLHKTKGLEGEIVIMMDRRSRQPASKAKMSDADKFYPGYSYRSNFGSESLVWSSFGIVNDLLEKNEKDSDAEFHRLEYVAVTRAKQAVFFMNTISNEGLFSSKKYNYKLDNSKVADEIIDMKDNQISSTNPAKYDFVKEDNYELRTDSEDENGFEPRYVKVNPSGLENGSSAAKSASKKENLTKVENISELEKIFERPFGDVLGDCLHRTMELLIDRYSEEVNDDDIKSIAEYCALQAVSEHEADIPNGEDANMERIGLKKGDDAISQFRIHCAEAAYAYYKWLIEHSIMNGLDKAYTELPFSYFDKNGVNKKGEIYPEWVNGTADLILKYKDGRVLLIDYKSDNDFLVSEEAMHEGFNEIYSPQVAVYRKIIKRVFGVADDMIDAGIISFSLREKDDMFKRVPNGKMRVRCTKII